MPIGALPAFRLSDIQIFKHPNFQTSKFQTFRLSDIQTFIPSNFQTSKLSDFQTLRLLDMQTFIPFQYDLRCPAPKDNSITHAAAAPSNLDAASTMRSADAELQNTKEIRATASEIAAPKTGSRRPSKKKDFEVLFKKELWKKHRQRQNWENLLTNHYRSLDAAIPIRLTMSSCKRHEY